MGADGKTVERTSAAEGPQRSFSILGVSFQAHRPDPGLYLVATPIGNLADISVRALEVLAGADLILCEDTRHSARLLSHYGIRTARAALHDHNERARSEVFANRIGDGAVIALISDAGTPLLSDPGHVLAVQVRDAGLPVFPVPGASALLAAITGSGLPMDRFSFFGFPPARQAALKVFCTSLRGRPETLVFYESPRRLGATLQVFSSVFGADRTCVIARELTKKFERFNRGSLGDLATAHAEAEKGEVVLLVAGAPRTDEVIEKDWQAALELALEQKPLSQAVRDISQAFEVRRSEVYAHALQIKS